VNPDDIQIKDYQIHLPPLGQGSYGCVYRATYRGISDRALKIFRPGAVDLSTMARELEKLSSVAEHHGIVTLHDFDLLTSPPYYAMGLHADKGASGEWDTRTLEQLCGKVDHREAWRLLREIADALAYLHRNHIIHCDVKPTNVLLTDETPRSIKICDFGQSRGDALEGFEPAGTPLYASPEQLRNPRDSAEGKGFRWDVYSFGVVAYKLYTGKLPRLQRLSEAEQQKSQDLEATIAETSDKEATMSESRHLDSEHLAELTEKEAEIEWPDDVTILHDHKELIERCLQLDPAKRPTDMREVWARMQQLDQQRVVRRARRLNALFATLLVIAIWASGLAFIQARRAKAASEVATKTREQAEGLVSFIVNKLNREELSGPGLDELYEHIADNAEIYLDNFLKTQRSSTLLRISANTASLRGRQALERGNLDLALEKFRNAHEIRAQLAENNDKLPELAWLASNDLIEIGNVLKKQGLHDDAISAYSEALEWRTRDLDLEQPLELTYLRRVIEVLASLGGVHLANGSPKLAIEQFEKALALQKITAEAASPDVLPLLNRGRIPLLRTAGAIHLGEGDLEKAAQSYEELVQIANSLNDETEDPNQKREASIAYADGLSALGRIQLTQEELEAALALFRDEIRYRERIRDLRPYDPEPRIALADAYANLTKCLDTEDTAERSVALRLLEQALSLVAKLPPDWKDEPEIQTRFASYRDSISKILELEE